MFSFPFTQRLDLPQLIDHYGSTLLTWGKGTNYLSKNFYIYFKKSLQKINTIIFRVNVWTKMYFYSSCSCTAVSLSFMVSCSTNQRSTVVSQSPPRCYTVLRSVMHVFFSPPPYTCCRISSILHGQQVWVRLENL